MIMTKQPKSSWSSYQKTIKSYNYFTEFSCRILEMSCEVNGSQRGSNPANRASKRRQWSEESMIGAMKAVAEGTSISGAAREHGVPRTTLQDRVLGKVTHGTKPGPKRYLNEVEEKKLSEFLVETAALGYGRSRGEIMAIAEGTTKKKGTLRKNKISHGWFDETSTVSVLT